MVDSGLDIFHRLRRPAAIEQKRAKAHGDSRVFRLQSIGLERQIQRADDIILGPRMDPKQGVRIPQLGIESDRAPCTLCHARRCCRTVQAGSIDRDKLMGLAERLPPLRKLRIKRHALLKQGNRLRQNPVAEQAGTEGAALQIEIVSGLALGLPAQEGWLHRDPERDTQCGGNRLRDVLLQVEDVIEAAFIAVSPGLEAGLAVQKPYGNADLIFLPLY